MSTVRDVTGQRFGRLVVLYRDPGSLGGRARWICRCDCGATAAIFGRNLRSRKTTSCGCYRRDRNRRVNPRNAQAEYEIWIGMRKRCGVRGQGHPDYSGRGIWVCEAWAEDYNAFIRDMGRRPGPAYSIDRIDNDGPYSPENCRWATVREQGNNRRTNKLITAFGVTATLAQWSEAVGIHRDTLEDRINYGWDVERALTTAPRRRIA